MHPFHAQPVDSRALLGPTPMLALLDHFSAPAGRFVVPRHGNRIEWDHHAFHAAAHHADPELHALLALSPDTTDAHRVQVLFQILRAPHVPALDRIVAVLLANLSDDDVLQVFLALRRVRLNRKHATRALVGWLAGHPVLGALVARRRPAVRDALDHALGKVTARAALRAIVAGEPAIRLGGVTAPVAAWLLRQGPAPDGEPLAPRPTSIPAAPPRPQTVTATNRGPISAALVHLWRGDENPDLRRELVRAVSARTGALPRFGGRIALVLDLSASMAGYGDREHAGSAQAVALWLTLADVVPDLHLVPVGGHLPDGDRIAAALRAPTVGSTDLAGAVLRAARTRPDLIVVVTDGYENAGAGDLAAVASALRGPPIVLCNVLFSPADDLSDRHPAPGLPELRVWHEDDFDSLLLRLFAHTPGDTGRRYLRDALLACLREV